MEYKAFKLDSKSFEDESGSFEGYASVFGIKDLQDDVVEVGAFKRTLDHNGGRVPLLWQHNLREPIGVSLQMKEDDRGLLLKGQLNLDTQRGREAYALLKQGALKGLSIGYDVVNHKYQKGLRLLKELKLHEVSLVTIGANPEALIASVKSLDDGDGYECPGCGTHLLLPEEEKAGRTLSRATRKRIQQVMEELSALLESADIDPDPADGHSEGDAKAWEPSVEEGDPEPETPELHSLHAFVKQMEATAGRFSL